jgi:hypothetical protein
MKIIKIIFLGLSMTLLSGTGFSQKNENLVFHNSIEDSKLTKDFFIKSSFYSSEFNVEKNKLNQQLGINIEKQTNNISFNYKISNELSEPQNLFRKTRFKEPMHNSLLKNKYSNSLLLLEENEPFFKNKRNLYSSMWAFASLNYIYADLISLMDKNILSQYQTGVVNSIKITPNFLATAAVFMQIPLANVFLPQVIKNERTLRWVQIASGTVMTLVQASTLFVGKPTPHYAVFSALEIAATTFITIDAIKWKPKKRTRVRNLSN